MYLSGLLWRMVSLFTLGINLIVCISTLLSCVFPSPSTHLLALTPMESLSTLCPFSTWLASLVSPLHSVPIKLLLSWTTILPCSCYLSYMMSYHMLTQPFVHLLNLSSLTLTHAAQQCYTGGEHQWQPQQQAHLSMQPITVPVVSPSISLTKSEMRTLSSCTFSCSHLSCVCPRRRLAG